MNTFLSENRVWFNQLLTHQTGKCQQFMIHASRLWVYDLLQMQCHRQVVSGKCNIAVSNINLFSQVMRK